MSVFHDIATTKPGQPRGDRFQPGNYSVRVISVTHDKSSNPTTPDSVWFRVLCAVDEADNGAVTGSIVTYMEDLNWYKSLERCSAFISAAVGGGWNDDPEEGIEILDKIVGPDQPLSGISLKVTCIPKVNEKSGKAYTELIWQGNDK